HALISTCGQFLPHRIAFIAATQSTLHDQAATRDLLLAERVRRTREQSLDGIVSLGRGESVVPEDRVLGLVAIERLAEQRLLAAEGGVEAPRIDAHRLGQIDDRGALVALAPEQIERRVERFVHAEGAWSAAYGFGLVHFLASAK